MTCRLLNLLTLAWLLICVAVVVLWVRGAWRYDKASVSYYALSGGEVRTRTFDANSRPGWVQWTIVRCDVPEREGSAHRGLRWSAGSHDVENRQDTPPWVRFGFGAWGESKTTDVSKSPDTTGRRARRTRITNGTSSRRTGFWRCCPRRCRRGVRGDGTAPAAGPVAAVAPRGLRPPHHAGPLPGTRGRVRRAAPLNPR